MMTAEIRPTQTFHPLKFMMRIAIASICMLFAGLTSAVLVRKAQGDWLSFRIPAIFWLNTLIIILSSVTIQYAVYFFKKYQVNSYRIAISATFLLGCLFIALQFIGWQQLAEGGIRLSGNPSGSYLRVLTYTHAAHIGGGLLIMLFGVLRAWFAKFNPNRLINVQNMATYWHFVDVLWIYLIIFFQINLA